MAVGIKRVRITTRTTEIFNLVGAPDYRPWSDGSLTFRPDALTIIRTNEKIETLTLSGPRVFKSGKLGETRHERSFWRNLDDLPEWVIDLFPELRRA